MRRAVVLLAAAAPLALAACGGSGKSSSSQSTVTPTAYVLQAARKSAQASTEHIEMKAVTTVQGQTVNITATGDFANAAKQGAMNAHATVAGVDVAIDEILDGTTIYMKSPLFAAALPSGKTWLKLDLQKLGHANGIDFSQLMSQSPTQSFAQLEASGQVKKIGDENLSGVETTHYRGRIDVSKLPQGAKIEQLTKAKYGPYDVWIGKDDGLVRKTTMTYSYVTPGAGRQTATMTMNFSDFGKQVSVNVPPAADTVDATNQTMKGLGH